MDFLLWRRDCNLEWAKVTRYEPDEDPLEFCRAFKSLIRDVFKRSTGKRAAFRWEGKKCVVVASETGEEDDEEDAAIDEPFYKDCDHDRDEDDSVHTTDEEGSEGTEENWNPEDESNEGNDDEEVWEDAPES